jgi:preprotein translocase subunit SecG
MPWWAKWGLALLIAVALISIGWRYSFVLVTLHVMVCFVLVIVIMLQSGNAADLAGAFGGAGSQTAFGPRGAASFLSRATTWCAIVFMMTSLTLSVKRAPAEAISTTGSVLEQTRKPAPAGKPGTPATPPGQTPGQLPAQPGQSPAPAPAPSQNQAPPAPAPAPAQNQTPAPKK